MSENNISKKQTRVVIVGNSPLPMENAKKTYAPGIRTWHFGYSAKEANCKVMIIGCRIQKSYDAELPDVKFEKINDMYYYSVEPLIFENKNWLKEKIINFKPDCIIGVNTYPSSIVAQLDLDYPFWTDLNGSAMAEAQAKASVYDDNSYLEHFFKQESKILGKADIFSTVSESQGFSLIGELSIWGRLNKETMGYRFVRVIPNTLEKTKLKHTKSVIRGVLAKDSDFVILYSGGYNTWTDVKTLFEGLEKAMAKNPQIVFVSTGGEIIGHDEFTYETFKNMIKNSPYKQRFHLCGWVPSEDLPNYYLEADLGINSDKYCYEAILGARTRVLDWLKTPLPFISTTLSEVTNYLVQNNLAISFIQGDSDDLAEKLIKISTNSDQLKQMKSRILDAIDKEFTAEHTFREFREWLKNPKHSPDFGKPIDLISKNFQNKQSTQSRTRQNLAIKLWPSVSNFLRTLGLRKYENQVKKFGVNLVVKTPNQYRVQFLDISLPKMKSGGKYIVPITLKNTGKEKWLSPLQTKDAINLSYYWKNFSDNKIVLKNEERTPLHKSVKPNEKICLSAMIIAPTKIGEYFLEIDMVKENNFWFSEVGSKPYRSKIQINENSPIPSDKLPKISVIVVTYNSEKYIKKCLDSILESNYPNYEILVIDNASSDNTLSELKKFQNKLKLIKNKKNLGFTKANNIGIKNSKGKIIVLINPDAYVTKNAILELVLPFLEDKKIMITGSKIYYPETKKIQSAGGIIQKNGLTNHLGYGEEDNYQFNYPRSVEYVTGAAMAVRKKLFEITGLFDSAYSPAYYEETDKCLRARKLGYKVVYVPESVVYHHESTTLGALSKNYLQIFHRNRFRFIYRNYGFLEFFRNFIPYELKWFLFHCSPSERGIVIKAHLKTILSPKIVLKKSLE